MSFLKGNIGESLWLSEISKTHTDIEKAPNKKFYDWDVKAKYKGEEVTYEVKYDSKGYYYADRYNRPVNIYIEFLNTKKGEDSGIIASKATYYVYILKSMDNTETAYVFNRIELLKYLKNADVKVKGNSFGGDNNAKGWIPSLNSLEHLILKKVLFI
tara:strand:- start:2230 stop:2700 length:471 start_codon:yes stop_codon:yes gene_type:complete